MSSGESAMEMATAATRESAIPAPNTRFCDGKGKQHEGELPALGEAEGHQQPSAGRAS